MPLNPEFYICWDNVTQFYCVFQPCTHANLEKEATKVTCSHHDS